MGTTSTSETGGSESELWQQPELLAQPPKFQLEPPKKTSKSGERIRQAGLIGIAEARAALAEAARRAQARAESRANEAA